LSRTSDGTRVVCELDGSGNVTASYGYGAAGLAQRYVPASLSYTAYVYDPMGNVTMRMRQLDAATQPYDLSGYDAFGKRMLYQPNVQQTQLNPPDAVGYGGQLGNYTDVEANLVLMTYRFYSPVYCRFLTRDPSGYGGGINLYAYCRNNPINRFDPLGLDERSSNNPGWP
jgi:RHS repeat-associated protein